MDHRLEEEGHTNKVLWAQVDMQLWVSRLSG